MLVEESKNIRHARGQHAAVVSASDFYVLMGDVEFFHLLDPWPGARDVGNKRIHVALNDDERNVFRRFQRVVVRIDSRWLGGWSHGANPGPNRGVLDAEIHRAGATHGMSHDVGAA